MKTILWKLIKDFRKTGGKVALLLLAAILSSWGISTMVYSYFLTERDFATNFIRTYPADIAITIDDYNENLIRKLLDDENVIDVERREVVNARVKNNQDAWMPITIYATPNVDNMRYDLIRILNEKNLTSGKFLIEKNAFYFLEEDQGSVTLQFLESDSLVNWKVDGMVHDARQAPARMEGIVYAYSTSIEQIEPYLKKGRRRLLIKTNVSESIEQLEKVYERLNSEIETSGSKVIAFVIPTPGEHIHQGIVDSIAFLQESGGTTLSIMGIVLLSLILLTWVFPQVVDIGIMKAIGASTTNIFWSYVMALLIIILAGMFIGLPLGYITGVAYNNMVAFFQNFEVVKEILPLPVHLLTILIGLAIPLLFGILPLRKASITSVREAMNKTFYTPKNTFFRLSRIIGTNPRFKYIINNLLRNSQRTALTILLISVGIALFFTSANSEYSIRKDLNQFADKAPYELGVAFQDTMNKEQVSFLSTIASIEDYLPLKTIGISYTSPTMGVSKESYLRMLSQEVIIPDEFIERGVVEPGCKECIYISGLEMSEEFSEIDINTPITLTNKNGDIQIYRFSGVLKEVINLSAPFVSYAESANSSFNYLLINLDKDLTKDEILEVSNNIDDAFIDAGINLKGTTSVQRRIEGVMNHLDPTFLIIKLMGVFTIILGLLGLIIVLNLTLKERTRDLGIMKAVGASRRKISELVTREFLWISFFSLLIGGVLAIPVAISLIDLIAETIIRHPVSYANDIGVVLGAFITVLVGQTAFILFYSQSKMRKNARELLDHNF